MKKKSWILIIIGLVVVLTATFLVILTRVLPTPVTPTPSPPEPIKIGGQAIMSGPWGEYGRMMKMGAVLAVEEINAAGGVLGRPLELKWMDDELNNAVAIENFRYLVNEWGADLLMGIDSSGVAMATGPVLPELDRICIYCHAATHRLTEELVYEKGIEHIFRITVPIYQDSIAAAIIFSDKERFPKLKRWAGINPDYEYGYVSWELFKHYLKELRPEVEFVYESWCPFGTVDFTPYLSGAMATEPDGIYTTEWAGEAVMLAKQALTKGVFDKIKVWYNAMGGAEDVLTGLALEVKKDVFKGNYWASGRSLFNWPETAARKDFIKRFHDRFDAYPNYSADAAYDAIYLFKEAAEKVGIETAKLIEVIPGMTVEASGITRQIRPEDHQAIYPVPTGRLIWSEEYRHAMVGDLIVLPVEKYYRYPPFKPIE